MFPPFIFLFIGWSHRLLDSNNVDLYETHKRKEHKFVSLMDKNVASKPTHIHTYIYCYIYIDNNKLIDILVLAYITFIYITYMKTTLFCIVWYWKIQICKFWSQLLIFVHSNCCHRVYLTKGIRCNTMISSYITWI